MVRRKSVMVRSVMAMAAGAAALACAAGPAQAYDRGNCERAFGAANVESVDTIREDTGSVGKVDFGDVLHIGGAPYGTAVVCWHRNGGVAVVGRAFADSTSTIDVDVLVEYFDASGIWPSWHSFSGSYAASKVISEYSGPGAINRVRIKLYRDDQLVATINRYR